MISFSLGQNKFDLFVIWRLMSHSVKVALYVYDRLATKLESAAQRDKKVTRERKG